MSVINNITDGLFTDEWEISFNGDWCDIDGVKSTIIQGYYKCKLENNKTGEIHEILCSSGHIFNTVEYGLMSVDNIVYGAKLTHDYILYDKIFIDDITILYDILDVDNEKHLYDIVDEQGNLITHSKNCAFISNWEEFSASVLPVLSSGKTTKLILLSTPNGLNHVYDYYVGAKNNTNGFKLFNVMWDEVPNRDEEWKEETLRILNYNMRKFAQEYCVEFTSVSDGLIDSSILRNIKDELNLLYKEQPYRHDSNVNEMCVYKQYEKDKLYVATVDVSRGKGLDYSVMTIFSIGNNTNDPYNYEQVAMLRTNQLNPQDFAYAILGLCKLYNNPYILVETNDLGAMVSNILYEAEYDNLISTIKERNTVKVCFGNNIKREKGLRTTLITKNNGCNMLKLLIEQRKIKINDINTVNELFNFIKSGSSYSARVGKHDDICMTFVLFAWLLSDSLFVDYTINENGDVNTNSMFMEYDDNYYQDKFYGFIYRHDDDDFDN